MTLEKPSPREAGQWYFQCYFAELPAAGEIVLFDRSWYNRAVVEPVMGFCSDREYEEFMAQAPNLEPSLVDDGIHPQDGQGEWWVRVPGAAGSNGKVDGGQERATQPVVEPDEQVPGSDACFGGGAAGLDVLDE